MGSGKGRSRRAQAAAMATKPAQTEERAARLEAYKEVQAIIAEVGASKLTETESSDILWSAEGFLLASSSEDPEVAESQTTFTTLMDNLESHRWSEMLGTPEYPGTATRLREAFNACGPQG